MSALASPAEERTPPVAGNLLESIGNTPLFRLARVAEGLRGIEIYGKAEYLNPGGSVKDRPALNMLNTGEQQGKLTPDKVILDSTSGNTGIAYAMIAAARGYRVKLCLPANASAERKSILLAYGAELILTDGGEGSDGAIRRCQAIYAEDPGRYFYPDQYSNPANWQAHYNTTGVEILEQTDGRITHFVTALGTSGTFMGTSRRLRADGKGVVCISAQPAGGFHGLEGLKHMPTAIVPSIYDPDFADDNVWIETEDAYKMVRRLAREEGVMVGISSGANVHAAVELGKRFAAEGREAVIVTVLCDGASKYMSEPFWNE
jgi:S-sulfo-L-cysteine synthase (O-acetyl-L-serine-dependent)